MPAGEMIEVAKVVASESKIRMAEMMSFFFVALQRMELAVL